MTLIQSFPEGNGDGLERRVGTRSIQLARWWKQEVVMGHADIVFIICYFITGLVDSSAFNAWSCFAIMQTGNTIFLGLGASNQPEGNPYGWLKSLITVCFFLTGSFIFSQLSRRIGLRQRRVLSISFFVQGICILISAALIQAKIVPHPSSTREASTLGGRLFLELIPLFLLAFQGGGQMAASRGMGFNELPTTVLTSVYYDLSSDPKLAAWPSQNVKRNRRIGGVIALLIGAIAGGWIFKSKDGLAIILWIAAGIKLTISVSWCFWKGEKDEKNNLN
ncbi:uncharacterized protein V1513DRAFT_306258 [Lipomyces chichibuensis]|uniref:uncharacterized protein n=1 Tax=Lipomyces chichibuensis TaxID=1546026 RepID=UPI0033441135